MLDLAQLDLSCILCAYPEHDFVTRRKRRGPLMFAESGFWKNQALAAKGSLRA